MLAVSVALSAVAVLALPSAAATHTISDTQQTVEGSLSTSPQDLELSTSSDPPDLSSLLSSLLDSIYVVDTSAPSTPNREVARNFHMPIHIDGDDDLKTSDAVRSGNGTAEDPYVISDWVIPPVKSYAFTKNVGVCRDLDTPVWTRGRDAITIQNTRAHVVIDNVYIRPLDPTSPYLREWVVTKCADSDRLSGITLRNSRNVQVRNSVIEEVRHGLDADDVADLSLHGSKITRTLSHPIHIEGNNDERYLGIEIVANKITDTSGASSDLVDGIQVGSGGGSDQYPGLSIRGNEISKHARRGVLIVRAPDAVVTGNSLRDNGQRTTVGAQGLYLGASPGAIVKYNEISSNRANGIRMDTSPNAEIHRNNIAGNAKHGLSNDDNEADATYNWWGCSSGPDDADCDSVSGTVIYDPWLSSPVGTAGADLTDPTVTDANATGADDLLGTTGSTDEESTINTTKDTVKETEDSLSNSTSLVDSDTDDELLQTTSTTTTSLMAVSSED